MSDRTTNSPGPRVARRGPHPRGARRPRLEVLEDRTLLDGTPIAQGQAQAILDGLLAFSELGSRLDGQAALVNRPLDLLMVPASRPGGTTTETTLAALVPFGPTAGAVETAVLNYVMLNPAPTFEGLEAALQTAFAARSDAVTLTLGPNLATYAFTNLRSNVPVQLGLDLGGRSQPVNLGMAPTAAPLGLTAGLTLPEFSFSLELGSGRFYFNTPQVEYALASPTLASSFTVSSGFLSATAVGSTITPTANATSPRVSFRDPLGIGQITTDEIRDYLDGNSGFRPFDDGTGTLGFDVTVPLRATFGSFQTSTAVPPTVEITDNDLLDGTDPDYAYANYDPIRPFTAVTAGGVLQIIDRIILSLERLSESSVFDAPIPFTGGQTVGANLLLDEAIRSSLAQNLQMNILSADGTPVPVPTFGTAQDLVAQLSSILKVDPSEINPTYDPIAADLKFTIKVTTANPAVNVPFVLDRPDLGARIGTSGNALSFAENGTLSFTFGVNLGTTSKPKLSTSSPAQGLTGPVIPLDGRLSADSTFTLTDQANYTTTVTVTAASTATNTTPFDLAADFNAALRAAGLTTVTAALEALSPRLTGTGAFPGDGRLAADSSFTLAIDRNAPVSVKVTQAATSNNNLASDLIADYNAAIAAAGLSGIVAQIARPVHEIVATQAVPGNGRLTAAANFTLTIDQGSPVAVTVTQAAVANNATPSDLLNDLNAALRAAGLANIVGGLRSQVVGGVARTALTLYAVQPGQIGTLTLHTSPSDPAATQLGFADGQVGDNLPSLAFAAGATSTVRLLTLTAPAADPLVTQFGFATAQSEGFLSARLTLTPTASDFLRFNAASTDPSIVQLGFADGQLSRSSSIVPFVEGMTYEGAMSLTTLANPPAVAGNYGFVGVAGKGLAATASAQIGFTVKGANGVPGGRLSIRELVGDTAVTQTTANLSAGSTTAQVTGDPTGLAVGHGVRGRGLAPDTTIVAINGASITLSKAATLTVAGASIAVSNAPALVTTPTTTGSGSAKLSLSVPGLGVDAQTFTLVGTMADVDNPFTSFKLDTSGMGTFRNYQHLTFQDVAGGLGLLNDYLAAAGSFRSAAGTPVLTTPLPFVNRSVNDLTGYAAPFGRFVAQILAQPTATLQDFQARAATLLANAGTQSAVTVAPTGLGNSTTLGLAYAFTLANLFDNGLRLDIDGIPGLLALATGTQPGDAANLAGIDRMVDTSVIASTVLPTTASAVFDLTMGFDLSDPMDPKPFLFSSSDLATISLNVNAPTLNGVPLSIGRIGLFADGGSASLGGSGGPASAATFTIAAGSIPGTRVALDGTANANSRVAVAGQGGVSLPISLVPTGVSPPLSPPLTIRVTSLAGLFDGVAGSLAPILAPSLAGYEQLIEMIQKTPNLTTGINKYLSDFQDALNSQVLGLAYPVVGTQFLKVGQLFDAFRVGLSFQAGQDAYTADPVASIQNTLFQIFGAPGLGWLVNANGGPGTLGDVIVNTDNTSFVNWSAHLRVTPAIATTQIGFDVGLPGLQMAFPTTADSLLNTVDLSFGFDHVFNFGIDVSDGFYVDTSPANPLTITFDAVPHVDPMTMKPAPMSGTFGFFNIDVTPDKNPALYANTRFKGGFTVLVNGGASVPDKLVYKDLIDEKFAIVPTLVATGTANLGLATSYPNSSFSLQVLSDYEMHWTFAASDADLRGSQPLLGFYGIGTNWSDAVENFLGPTFGKLGNFLNTAPIGPILDFLGTPLPVLSYLLGPTDIVQFLGIISGGPAQSAGFQALLDAVDLYRGLTAAIPTGGYQSEYNLKIDQGDMVITQDVREIKTLADITQYETPRDPTLSGFLDQIDAYEAAPNNKEFTTDDDGGVISGKLSKSFNIGLANASIKLPFFSDPKFVKAMLLGRPGDLFQLVTPEATFTIQAEIDFPPIPIGPIPLVISAGGSIQPGIQFGFGFDTRGYDLAASGHPGNIGEEGFYFLVNTGDQAGTVLDVPLKLFFGAGTGIPDVVTLSLDIYFLWDNQLGLKDINNNGRVYLDQFSGIDNFQLSGSLQVGAQIDLQIFFFHIYLNVWNPVTLFSYATSDESKLARLDADGVLRLNVGPSASARLNGDTADGSESVSVRHVDGVAGAENVEVTAFGVSQIYRGVRRIFADGGAGDDSIEIAEGVLSPTELWGGDGRNRLIHRGSGSVVLRGGPGDDELATLGTGPARVESGGGNDRLLGGAGTATFEIGGGNHSIIGGTGDLILRARGGLSYRLSDTGLGIDGYTSTLQGVRRVALDGDDRANTFRVSAWSGDAVLDGVNGPDRTFVSLGGGGSVTVARSGYTGRDSVTVIGDAAGGTLDVTSTSTSRGSEVVSYPSRTESLTIEAGAGDTTINLLGNAEGLTAIRGGAGTTTLNVVATNRFTRTTFDGGSGDSVVRIGRWAVPGAPVGSVRGGFFLTGGGGRDRLAVDLDGDLANLLHVRGFDEASTVQVRGDLAHALDADSRSLSAVDISGSLTSAGLIRAGSIDRVQIGGDLAGSVDVSGPLGTLRVWGDLSGTVNVLGRLGEAYIAGATPGLIGANDVGIVAAGAARGPVLMTVIEAGVRRTVTVTPVVPNDPGADAVRFVYYYDSTGPGTPGLALRATNPTGARFDLALSTGSSADFDLRHLSAEGRSGVRHVAVEGDLEAGAIDLPGDRLGVVAVRGGAHLGSIRAASVEGVAFSALKGPRGRSLSVRRFGSSGASGVLRRGTRLARADGTIRVPVREGHSVALFLRTGDGRGLDAREVRFYDTLRDGLPNEAVVDVVTDRTGLRVRSIRFTGPGGVVRTRLPVGTGTTRVPMAARAVDALLLESSSLFAERPLSRPAR